MNSTLARADSRPASQRVVITGLGVFSSIGTGVAEFTEGLRTGRSNVAPITAFDTSGFEYANGAEVAGFEPEKWIHHSPVKELGRATQFSVAAARMAVEDAGLADEDLRGLRGQISIGTTDGESRDADTLVAQRVAGDPQRVDRALARRLGVNGLSAAVAREFSLTDVEALTLGTACSAGNYSVGNGFDAIRVGDADFALCGGADAICLKNFVSFYRLGTVAPDVCRPFDKDRRGLINSEGAGVVMLESLESALARGARIYSEVLGYGLSCDAHHPAVPDQSSVARCMTSALENAGVAPHEVDLISAHGTGTKANDTTEARAIRDIYDNLPPRTISLKSMLGHAMGAASALATIACSLAITHGFIPPTINHVETDPECEIDCVPNESVPADLRIVQNNGLAFGGNNSVVVLGRHDKEAR
ncbi:MULTISPECIES: beta-ketoacyl-[acyl-carrier-protein] synthase family protein [Streptomyces]|jgi:3-oxoacyl-[acyl-carrier-protein] synthase II|uniref:Beta-ketoacyl-[acyl-carrier-protein] synthase family protein n=1 Tax=Streptomyces ortus TaxID=2867268 RepID=A0ABT3VFR7_9ACTN|nr:MULTISPECIES: beta-ketoacyl-[acyl-carrier-protein] synthase family protein [Streptomyces]MCX4238797.1 beta-ketoacyl-[acyl-carrier-protein] synthase family protein [Streptomyces ortus]